MPRTSRAVPTEGQVKAAIARSKAAVTEAEASLTEVRELVTALQDTRFEAESRLQSLLSQTPGQMIGSAINQRGPR